MAAGTTLQPLIGVYLTQRTRRGELDPRTARNYRYALTGFARSYGRRPVSRLAARDVERWQETLTGRSPGYRRQQFSMVRQFCRWLVERGSLRRDPFLELRSPREPRRVPRALKTDAVALTLAACTDTRTRLIILLMVQQGLRCVEVSRLQLGDLDLDGAAMRIVGKGGHERVLPITEEVRAALAAHLRGRGIDAGPLIQSMTDPGRGITAKHISRLVSACLRDAGVKQLPRDGVSGHAFRHTAATDMLRNGAHLRDVQHALGHAHLATTEVYLPHIVHGLDKAMGGRSYTSMPSPADELRRLFSADAARRIRALTEAS